MKIGYKQKIITTAIEKILNEPAITGQFNWFINKHQQQYFMEGFGVIDTIFKVLKGNYAANQNKKEQHLKCDAFFKGQYNFMFEFDEVQHFSSARLKTLELYPKNLNLNFDISNWKFLCKKYHDKADKYRYNKACVDFNFKGGRTSQRAYLDCFRDILPCYHGLNPTLRINEFEIMDVLEDDKALLKRTEQLLKKKLTFI